MSEGIFFLSPGISLQEPISNAWSDNISYFERFHFKNYGAIPNWFGRPISGLADWPSTDPWWCSVNPPNNESGDIKEVWELSRFYWLIPISQRAASGNEDEVNRLNLWLSDWVTKNPAYYGPNWVCAQEASIRVLHLGAASIILGQNKDPSVRVLDFLRAHIKRIASTLSYSIAQDNNHGILEAAGLFIGAEWLNLSTGSIEAKKWATMGRKLLEDRVKKLIANDGSFSMYSVTYHREFLDALSFVEIWRRQYALPSFSSEYQTKVRAAVLWLYALTDPKTGDAPNIGGNDGTRLFQFSNTGYRDFRPSVQVASTIFWNLRAYERGNWDNELRWLNIDLPANFLPSVESCQFDNGGLALLKSKTRDVKVFMRYPRFRFRPSKPDALHIDLWIDGINIFRGSGSYTYDSSSRYFAYFAGTESHNTIQFDGRDQMLRLSKFLLGYWLKPNRIEPLQTDLDAVTFAAGYSDVWKANHYRSVLLDNNKLIVKDEIKNFSEKAILRWRLKKGFWRVSKVRDGYKVIKKDNSIEIYIKSDIQGFSCELVKGWESNYYMDKSEIDVLECEARTSGMILTKVVWKK